MLTAEKQQGALIASNFALKYFISTGFSAELSLNFTNMKALKCILPLCLFMCIGMICQAQVSNTTVAKNSKTSEASCQKKCAPVACQALAKLGVCTPEQAEKCQKNIKTADVKSHVPFATEVAAVSQSRTSKEATNAKTTNCAAVCASKKAQGCKAKTEEK